MDSTIHRIVIFQTCQNCSFTGISLIKNQYFEVQVSAFVNYELDICSFIAFQAFFRRLKKSLSGG